MSYTPVTPDDVFFMLRDLMPPGTVEEGARPHLRKPACEEADPMKRIYDDMAAVHDWAQQQTKETLAEWFAQYWGVAAIHSVATYALEKKAEAGPFPEAMKRMADFPNVIAGWANDDDSGLGKLEQALGITSAADSSRSSRIAVVVPEVGKTVALWEKLAPADLKEDLPLINILFGMSDKTTMYAGTFDNRLPATWWAELSLKLDEAGLWDRMLKQVHRDTHRTAAKGHLADQNRHTGSLGGRNPEATKAKPKVLQDFLLWLAEPGKHKNKSQFADAMTKKYPVLNDERGVRDWYDEWCLEHGKPVNAPPKTKPRKKAVSKAGV